MGKPTLVETYLKVGDMDRAVDFYEAFLKVKAKFRYEDRWTSLIDGLGLYNPAADKEKGVPMTEFDKETKFGNNVVVVFLSDDIAADHKRVKSIGATKVTRMVKVKLVTPYRFFHFQDTEGNLIEVGQYG